MNKDALVAAGMDVDGALARLMGSEALLDRLLGTFAADGNMAKLEAAQADGDVDAALEAAHTLKGVCGNLSMTTLFDLSSRACDLFRSGDTAAAFALVPQMRDAYAAMMNAIKA